MADVNINKFRASVVRDGSKPASPGFIVSEGQDPVDPAGNGQNHLPVTIATAATGLSITDSQVLGGAGTVGQYIRGDGSLADFPQASGGGSSVSYYLNGSVSQGTIGGVAYKELNKVPILGAGTDFTINANGYIASFLTDAGDPNLLEIPGGNWNFETYFSASSGGGSPSFYVELYKYDGTTFTLIASSSSSPELIAFGTNLNPYFSTLAVPTTTLALTDRLAIRYYVNHSGRTITLHTENNHLCQVVTTFTTGLTSLNGLTAQVQNLAVGTSGTDFNIASATATHTFNLPTASATNRGALSSADWSMFNAKQNALTNPVTGTGTNNTIVKFTSTGSTIGNSQILDNGTNVGINTITPLTILDIATNASNALGIGNASDTITNGDLIGAITFISRDASTASSGGVSNIRSYARSTYNTGGVSADLRFYVTNGLSNTSQSILFGTEAMRITEAGFVWINGGIPGFTSSQVNLQVPNGARISSLLILHNISNLNNEVRISCTASSVLYVDGTLEATTIVKTGGTSSQFLKADGSVDSSTYLTTGSAGSTYVPYSGAAANVDLGVYNLTASAIIANGSGSNSGIIHLESNAFHSLVNGYGSISSGTTNQFNLYQTTGAGVFRCAILSLNSITASATRTFTLPDADGTFALSSDLSGYLPLTGGTISGQLNVGSGNLRIAAEGASNITILRNFTGTAQGQSGFNHVGFNNSNNFYFTKNLNNGAIFSFNNTAYQTYTLPDASGTLALTSSLGAYLPLTGGTLTGALNGTSASFSGAVTSGTKFISTAGNNNIVFESLSATTGYQYFQLLNNTAHTIFGIEGTAAGSLLTGGTANASVFTSVGNTNLEFGTNQIKRFTIAASTGAATFSSSVTAANFNAVSSNAFIIINDTSGNAAGQFQFQNNGIQKWNFATQATSNDLGLYNNGGTNSFNLYIKHSTGNVGIGTSSPASQATGATIGILDVSASSGGNLVLHRTGSSDTALFSILKASNGTYIDSTGAATAANNAIIFRVNNNNADQTTVNEAMRITSGGDVNFSGGAVRADGGYFAVRISGGSAASGYLLREATWLGTGTSTNLALAAENAGGELVFFTGGQTTTRMKITSGGNVLIGTTTDNGARLQVSGRGSFAGSSTVTGTVFISSGNQWSLNADQSGGGSPAFAGSGFYLRNENNSTIALGFNSGGAATFSSSVTATSFITSSDLRLKEVIEKDGDLAVYKRKGEEQIHYGYIAQEMQESYPNQVHEAQDGYLSLNYVEILVKKVNELEKKIKQLEE